MVNPDEIYVNPFNVNNQIACLSFVCLVFSSLHFCAMILIKEFSLASHFYLSQLKFALQNLRNALQIAKCEALICSLVTFMGYKKDDKKDKLDCILYI